ncbi:hypothetical protein [Embleya sp. NPDC059237]|uniref:hypothetical protein n=1 Tax=Embleya sp. NPDC059237 TaxID=3346784 RepID=UPI0036BACAA0
MTNHDTADRMPTDLPPFTLIQRVETVTVTREGLCSLRMRPLVLDDAFESREGDVFVGVIEHPPTPTTSAQLTWIVFTLAPPDATDPRLRMRHRARFDAGTPEPADLIRRVAACMAEPF